MKDNSIMSCDCNIIHEDAVQTAVNNVLDNETSEQLALFFKIFGDGTRIKILSALESTEMCVCDLACTLNMTKSSISHQLAILKRSSLVKYRKEGKEVFYSLSDDHIKLILSMGLEHISE